MGSIFSAVTKIYDGRSGVQILAEARLLLFSKTSRPAPVPTQPQINENQNFFSGSKLAKEDTLTTYIHLEPSLKISGAIPPLNLPLSMAHIGTTLIYHYLQTMYLFLKRSHPFWSCKGTFLYIIYLIHALYMTNLIHLH